MISSHLFEQKKLDKTSFCIKINYTQAFWREENYNGHILSFSGLLSKVFDISLPHEKHASLLIYPDKNYFSQLSESESKTLIIDELTDFFGERALSYIKYEKCTNEFQHEDFSQSFLERLHKG